jgi:hypothetical protein
VRPIETRIDESQSWVGQSPWTLRALHVAGDLVVLSHARFLATGSPLFWIRALRAGRHLSPDDGRLAWARDCLANAINRLDALIDRPPEKEKHWDSIIEALGFSMRPNYNPFREVRHILEKDNIYMAVRQHGKPLTGDKGAFSTVAKKFNVSEGKVKAIFYTAKRLVDRLDK